MNENQTIKALVKVIDADNILDKTRAEARQKLHALVEGVNNPTELFTKVEELELAQTVIDAEAVYRHMNCGGRVIGLEAEINSSFGKMLSTLNNLLNKHDKNKGE